MSATLNAGRTHRIAIREDQYVTVSCDSTGVAEVVQSREDSAVRKTRIGHSGAAQISASSPDVSIAITCLSGVVTVSDEAEIDTGVPFDPASPVELTSTLTFRPSDSATPQSNGDVTFELTSDTSLTVKVKGSDGVVRSAVLTLSA